MSVLQSAAQAVGQAVSDVASDVKDTVVAAATDTAKQVAKTPLDILEELLGSSNKTGDPASPDKPSSDAGQMEKAAIQQKNQQDDVYREQEHKNLHEKIMQQSQGYYQQKKQMEEQARQQQLQHEEQKKFEIKQLEKQKKENLQVQMAKQAANAESNRNVGAG